MQRQMQNADNATLTRSFIPTYLPYLPWRGKKTENSKKAVTLPSKKSGKRGREREREKSRQSYAKQAG